ncbi:MAG TPA: hypothetical protein VJO32_15340, partial [Ktedonobacteraceae bacterium]|nr:hypothetical protein [Ktedonobacteraceae bacterium]
FEWLHFVQATNLLQENGRFPDFNLLKSWQQKYRLDINISQIARKVNTFFRNEEFDLKQTFDRLAYDFEVEAGSIRISPVQFTTRWLAAIHEDMHALLIATCVSKCLNHDVARELRIATLAFPHPAREIEVSAIIVDAIPDFPRDGDNRISQTFPLLFTPDDLLPLIDVIELWDKGEQGLYYAIEHQFRKEMQGGALHSMKFHIGHSFIESVNNAGLSTNDTVIRRIVNASAAVIANQAKHIKGYKLHELRESEAANSPQRTRNKDNAKAWRLMIGKHGAGWRMHYWQIPTEGGSIIEFSNVVKESDDTIYG